MADVTIISSSIVRPKNINQSGRTKIHLTPFDLELLYVNYPQRGLLFPKPDSETQTRFISRLKTSLSTALEVYFPFAGRLVKVENLEDNTTSFFIDCDYKSGARFVHAESRSLSVSDLLEPHGYVPDFMTHFFPFMDVKSCDGVSESLLAIQVTEIKDGVFISFCYNHLVADGVSMWRFFHTWSKICSTTGTSNHHHQPLVLKGWFLEKIDYPIHVPVSETKTNKNKIEKKERIFHFTKKNISDLKVKANSEGQPCLKISSLQAVSAHMWRSIIRHNDLSRKGETRCKVAVDLRQRLNPPLEEECFGNIAYLTPAKATVEELMDRGLGWAALQISKLVRSQTNVNFQIFAEDWVVKVNNPKPSVGSRMAGDTIVVSSSHRFQVYDNDFGWGKPIAVRAGLGNSVSGNLVVFRGIEDGSIDIQATLWSHVLVNLLADAEFLENVTIA